MKFYISWSHSDPIYSDYFENCNMLVSPTGVNGFFNFGKWVNQPKNIIIDSGAYSYLNSGGKPATQKDVFCKQLRIAEGLKTKALICHLDHPINPKNNDQTSAFHAVERTLGNAYEFMNLYKTSKIYQSHRIEPMATIQGADYESITFCANELKRIGYNNFGLGSLAPLYNPLEIFKRINYASDIVGAENLHVFGISRIDLAKELFLLKIRSIDSTRPMKAAVHNTVFYSSPFRSYSISGAHKGRYKKLYKTLDCRCPVCKTNTEQILKVGSNKYTKARAIHNYYHLVRQLKSI